MMIILNASVYVFMLLNIYIYFFQLGKRVDKIFIFYDMDHFGLKHLWKPGKKYTNYFQIILVLQYHTLIICQTYQVFKLHTSPVLIVFT